MQLYDSSDRKPAEYVMFALAFIGFGIGLGGVILSLPAAAVFGAVILLLGVAAFRNQPEL